ncbi:MAG: hypothetical protein WA056_10450 [Gallionella sp.]
MKTIYLIAASILLTGCTNFSQWNDLERYEQITGVDKHSSYPIMRRDYFERVNLLELVDPERMAAKNFKRAWDKAGEKNNTNSSSPQWDPYQPVAPGAETNPSTVNTYGARYDLVLAQFRQRTDISDDVKRNRRNSIQERILASSMSRCNVFKTFLRRDQADQNFLFGSLTTAAGVLGAVLPGATASHNLAGAAGLFSGIRSEYNQAYYSNLAAHVIIKGIETKQEQVYSRIQSEGQSKDINAYPLEAAIKDAVYWDGLCSVVVGLDQAGASIDATNEPGLDAATRTLLRARLAKAAADLTSDQLLNPKTLESFGQAGAKLGMSLVGSARGVPVQADSDVDLFVIATKMTERLVAYARDAACKVGQAFDDKLKSFIDAKNNTGDSKDKEEAKSLLKNADAMAKAVTDEINNKLDAAILSPMNLNGCYSSIAASAVQERITAMQHLAVASSDAEKLAAKGEINRASLGIQAARDKLNQKEQLVNMDIDSYLEKRLAAINNLTAANAVPPDLQVIAPEPERTASAEQECK